MRFLLLFTALCTIWTVSAENATSQDHVKISGLAYLVYYYMINSPVADEEGDNGFTYRRLYLTTDFTISEDFKARARLETKASSTTPFIKDLFVQRKNIFGDGHSLTVGVTSPPSFTVSEKVWGFRSLDKTIQDRVKVVSSRDFGARLNGPITKSGAVKYSVMVANNEGVGDEDDKHKRVYSQLEFYPNENVIATVGGDFASGQERDATNFNAFLGFLGETFSVGAEGFLRQRGEAEEAPEETLYGISAFGQVALNDQWSAVGRFDLTDSEIESANLSTAYALFALVFSPDKNIKIMPNVIYGKVEGADSNSLTGRVTLEAKL